MPHVAFVESPGQNWFIGELAETVRYELELQDIPCTVHTDRFPAPRPDLLYVLPAPREFVALEGRDALPSPALLKRTVFLSAEPPGREFDPEDIALFQSAGAVFDIDVRSVLRLHRSGVPARTLRPGYSKLRDHFESDAPRPIDVIFLGAASPRRLRLLAACAPVLARYNCLLALPDPADRNAAGSGSFLAESKYELLAQAKVAVNLHRDEHRHMEWLRMLEAMHSGAVVVSDHASGLAPFEAGQHLLVSSEQALPFVIESVLRAPERAREVREHAYERLSNWLPFAMSIGVLRAALVELVGNPADAGAARGRPLAAKHERLDGWNPDPQPQQVDTLDWGLRSARADVSRLRSQVARLQQEIAAGIAGAAGAVRVVERTPAWRARRSPCVTAIVVACDDADHIGSSLDSLASSRMLDFELVVVDSASSDDSVLVTRRWLHAHPRIGATVISLNVDRGVGAARNVALGFARAKFCLFLDPGDAVYPRALDVLTGTLAAMDHIAVVYPIVEIDGAVAPFMSAGGEPLVNVWAWEPRRARLGNPLRPPYLVHASRLRALGGFLEDVRLSGWEDYDLWCQIARSRWAGQLVPQILGRRRARLTPADLPHHTAAMGVPIELLAERFPALLAGLPPATAGV